MIYFSGCVFFVTVGFILLFSGYRRGALRELYSMRGIYKLLYPPSYLIYGLVFKRLAVKRLSEIKALYPGKAPERIHEERYLKNISGALLVLTAAGAAALAVSVSESRQTVLTDHVYIARNDQGEGSREISLRVAYGESSEDVSITVGEQRLSGDGIEELKKQCEDYARKNVLGENPSLEHVDRRLSFFSEIPGYSVGVQWKTSDYFIVGMDGTVKNETLKAPAAVTLTAVFTYFDTSWEYSFDIFVEPAYRDEEQLARDAIYEAVVRQESITSGEDYMVLPDSLKGEKLLWSEKEKNSSGMIFLLGGIVIVLIFAREGESLTKARKARNTQLSEDYPVFVHKVVLLLGTGMTPKAAWFRIISDYNKNLEEGGKRRYVYEEMIVAANAMKQGITEVAAYESFGRRCQMSQYLKFSSILIQSVKTGARGMGRMLSDAGDEAVILRRENAKRIGEEAGTKLLFPMMILLGVVMCIVIIPAFMSMDF